MVRRDVIKVFKLLSDPTAPVAIRDLLVPCTAVSIRTTRASESDVLRPPRRRLTARQRHFSYRAAASWNSLPLTTRAMTSLGVFKRKLT